MTIKDIINMYRRGIVIGANIVFIITAYVSAFYVRFEFTLSPEYLLLILDTLPVLLAIKLICFYYFGLFSGLWKYASVSDIWQIVKANTLASGIFLGYVVFSRGTFGFPRSIFILDWGICVALLSGVRLLSRALRENFTPRKYHKIKKVLIVGAGEAGVLVLNELRKNMNYDVAGFIDDDPAKRGMTIGGKKIFGDREVIKDTAVSYGVEEIILAMPSQAGSVIREMVPYCKMPDVSLKIVPGMYKILSGEIDVKIREVEPGDLLGRETVEIDKSEVYSSLKGKTVLVTGAAGSIGSELCRQAASYSPGTLVMLDLNENDMYFLEIELKKKYPSLDLVMVMGDAGDIGLLRHVFSENRPHIVFHAAAYKHVPMMEAIPSAAVKNNVVATRNLVYASSHYNVERFVYISTDKAVRPTSIMGMTKRIGEMLAQGKNAKSRTKFMAVRFGNVLGSKGSVVPLFKEQIRNGGPVTVTHEDTRRYFMSVTEAVELVLQAGAIGEGGEIFVLDMGEPIKIYDLAENLVMLSGLIPHEDIEIKITGLRPGEKLFEETLHDTEKDRATKNDRIFVTAPGKFDIKKLIKGIKELENAARATDEKTIRRKIKEMARGFSEIAN